MLRPQSMKLEPDEAAEDSAAAKNFSLYCAKFLPKERDVEWTPEEVAIEGVLLTEAGEDWKELPREVQLNIMRAYETEKERLKTTIRQTKRIAEFRRKHELGLFPANIDVSALEAFETQWPMLLAGTDSYGHLILVDNIAAFKLDGLLSMPMDQLLHCKAQQLESLFFVKGEIASRLGHRVCKHIYIVNLAGLEARLFSSKTKAALGPLLAMTTDMFPETLWSLWLINAPASFRLIWSIVRSMLDPIVRAKVRMFGSSSKWMPAMQEVGIPISALPTSLGGSASTETFTDVVARAKVLQGVKDL